MFISNDEIDAIRYALNQKATYGDLEQYTPNSETKKLKQDYEDLERRFNELYNFTYLLADECGCDIQWKPAVEAGYVPVKRSKR